MRSARRGSRDRLYERLAVAGVVLLVAGLVLAAALLPGGPAAQFSGAGFGFGGGGGAGGGGGGGSTGTGGSGGSGGLPPTLTQSFDSSVDGTALSYYEWLPTNFSSVNAYPFVLFLHGQGNGSGATAGQSLIQSAGGRSVIAAGTSHGMLVGALNTRTADGWYVNSPYTGPQEQDVLDAVAHEKAIRHVSAVFLLGFSMGGVGASAIVSHHPALFAGLGIVEPCDDMFQVLAHTQSTGDVANLYLWDRITNGSLPSAGGYARGVAYYISAARFFPQNYSGIPVYGVDGGQDTRCPDNLATWPYQEGNATFLVSSCAVNATMLEPANCTDPLQSLAAANPGVYHWRFVYEAAGTHDLINVNGADLVSYWLGTLPDGLVCAAVGATPHAC